MRRAARSPRGKGGPAPTQCVQTLCFDPLVRGCVSCWLLRTPEPGPPAEPSSLAPGTAVQPQESAGSEVAGPGEALPLPALLFGVPALLGLALALVLVSVVSCRRRRLRGAAPPEAPDGDVPVWPPPGENPTTIPPAHNVPVPATELGSTELVTTKTAGPEQQ
ncbi:tumor necrosis factor receptor superfamily member 13C isoform 3-T3 [Molossus nigricans]